MQQNSILPKKTEIKLIIQIFSCHTFFLRDDTKMSASVHVKDPPQSEGDRFEKLRESLNTD